MVFTCIVYNFHKFVVLKFVVLGTFCDSINTKVCCTLSPIIIKSVCDKQES